MMLDSIVLFLNTHLSFGFRQNLRIIFVYICNILTLPLAFLFIDSAYLKVAYLSFDFSDGGEFIVGEKATLPCHIRRIHFYLGAPNTLTIVIKFSPFVFFSDLYIRIYVLQTLNIDSRCLIKIDKWQR